MTIYNQTIEQLSLAQEAVASVLAQDIPVDLFLVDNGSTDEYTWEWMKSLASPSICVEHHPFNISPVKIANEQMREIFTDLDYPYLLGIPSDAIIPTNLYREFLRWPRGVVTGSMTEDRDYIRAGESHAVNTCTPMAVALLRRWVYDALVANDGFFFDPTYFLYASDMDFALRIASCGITGIQTDLQYYHYRSASHRMLPPDKARLITGQADSDRDYFERRYGFKVDAPEYAQTAANINFRGVGR
jgi:glycosyltransferase involved in cell wall biosynthesis